MVAFGSLLCWFGQALMTKVCSMTRSLQRRRRQLARARCRVISGARAALPPAAWVRATELGRSGRTQRAREGKWGASVPGGVAERGRPGVELGRGMREAVTSSLCECHDTGAG